MGQSTARDPGTNSSAAAKTNTVLFAWYWGTDRAEGRNEMRGEGKERREERKGKGKRGERWITYRCRAFV